MDFYAFARELKRQKYTEYKLQKNTKYPNLHSKLLRNS